jgi:ABC-type sulfate/molybdate transport systems ATPase subunit
MESAQVHSELLLDATFAQQIGSLQIRASLTLRYRQTALFGPSGAGKTSVLRMLMGLIAIQAGHVRLDGATLVDTTKKICVPPARRGIGYLSQSPSLFPHLSVEANVRYGLRHLGEEQRAQRVVQMLRVAGLEALRARMPRGLSGGERQRVALARALAPGPKLLLLDEPFSGLDAANKAALWASLEPYLQREQTAMLLVTHDAAEAWERTERVIRIENGQTQTEGATQTVLAPERANLLRQLEPR